MKLFTTKSLLLIVLFCFISVFSSYASFPHPACLNGPTKSVCPGQTIQYSCCPVNGATSYVWKVPSTCTIVSGQGTENVSIYFGSNYTWIYLRVTATNGIDTSSEVTKQITSTPETPSGINGIVLGACENSTHTYSISPTRGATSYTWTAPSGAIITTPTTNGNPVTTIYTSVDVTFPPGYLIGYVSVVANSGCGTSPIRKVQVRSVTVYPGAVTGDLYGLCDRTGIPYSILPVNGATSYSWTINPTTGAFINNNGNTNITMDFDVTFRKTNLCVTADNACGSSTPRCIRIYAQPRVPNAIDGPIGACNNDSVNHIGYYSVDPVPYATYYDWILPNGVALLNGQFTNSISVDFYGSSTGGEIVVRAGNDCAKSTASSKIITINACRLGSNIAEKDYAFSIYPNPTNGKINIQIDTKDYMILIYDIYGRKVKEISNNLYSNEINLEDMNNGIYNVIVQAKNFVKQQKIVLIK